MASDSTGDHDATGELTDAPGDRPSRPIGRHLSDHQCRVFLLLLNRGEVDDVNDLLYRSQEEIRGDLLENHLPALAEAGFIEWDRETGTIAKGPRFEEIKPLLAEIEADGDGLPRE
jgi:hypothetical protein